MKGGVREGTAKGRTQILYIDHYRDIKITQTLRRPNGKNKKAFSLAVEIIQVRVSMLNENGSVRGCKKLNSQTLQGATAQALAVGTNEKLPAGKYRTAAQKNKQGVTSC